ncbi:PAS domain S-box protein [Magnetospira thiophila]
MDEQPSIFKTIVENEPNLIVHALVDGTLLYVNKAYADYFGSTPEALTGTNLLLLIPQHQWTEVQAHFQALSRESPVSTQDHDILKKDGRVRRMRWTDTAIRFDDSGRAVEFIGRGEDISAQKEFSTRLRASQTKYDILFHEMVSGYALHELLLDDEGRPCDYRFLDVNPAFEALTGLKHDDVVGKRVREVLADIEPTWIERYGRVVSTGETAQFVEYTKVFDKYFEVTAFRSGERQFAVTFTDITELKRTQRDLEDSLKRFELAMRGANDGLFDWNLATNEIYYSPRWKSMLGYQEQELPNDLSVWENLVDESDRKISWDMLTDYLEGRREDFKNEFKMRHKDGHWVDILSRAILDYDSHGKPTRVVGTHTDISDRKKAQTSLLAETQRLNDAQRIAQVGSWEWHVEADEVAWSDQLYRILNLEPASVIPTYGLYNQQIHPEDRDFFESWTAQALAGTEPYTIEYRLLLHDGSLKFIRERGESKINGQGKVTQVSGTVQDITLMKQAEQHLQTAIDELTRSNTELERFAYVASHDLQEPLRSVVSFSQLLEHKYRDSLDDVGKEYLDFIIQGATRMSDLVRDLLAYSKVPRNDLRFEKCDLNQIVAEARANLAEAAAEAAAEFDIQSLPVVQGDKLQLTNLMQNLMGNAIKYRRPDCSPHITVRAQKSESTWTVSVADDGIGIDPQHYDIIFDIFKRLHHGDVYPGTGLGLAACRRIVDQHKGRIWVESAMGKGSTFLFTLPMTE